MRLDGLGDCGFRAALRDGGGLTLRRLGLRSGRSGSLSARGGFGRGGLFRRRLARGAPRGGGLLGGGLLRRKLARGGLFRGGLRHRRAGGVGRLLPGGGGFRLRGRGLGARRAGLGHMRTLRLRCGSRLRGGFPDFPRDLAAEAFLAFTGGFFEAMRGALPFFPLTF